MLSGSEIIKVYEKINAKYNQRKYSGEEILVSLYV